MKNDYERIITLCAGGFPGTNRSLQSLEKTTGLTRHFVLGGSQPGGAEVKFYIELLKEKNPKRILFGGWSPVYDVFIKGIRSRSTEMGVYWTSSAGQVDISEEAGLLDSIISSRRLKHKLFANGELARALSGSCDSIKHLPDTVLFPEEAVMRKRGKKEDGLVFSLFCSPFEYKRKNVLNTLLALSMLKRKYTLYLNGLSENRFYGNILKTLRIRYRDFDWMTDEKYQAVLGEVDLGLQISFAETFNYVAAEHIVRRIPVMTSRMVPAVDGMPAYIRKRLVVDDPDSALEIRDKIEYLTGEAGRLKYLGDRMHDVLKRENEKRIEQAKNVLRSIIE
jgi:hypothetical protein